MSRKALDDQNAETAESVSRLNDLKSKLAEYESQVLEHTTAIASARGRCDEFTRGDVGRLQRMSPHLLTFPKHTRLGFEKTGNPIKGKEERNYQWDRS